MNPHEAAEDGGFDSLCGLGATMAHRNGCYDIVKAIAVVWCKEGTNEIWILLEDLSIILRSSTGIRQKMNIWEGGA